MSPLFALLLFCYSAMAQNSQPPGLDAQLEPTMNTTVCIVADYQNSLVGQTLRVRGHVYRVFDQLIIRDNGCRLVLDLPNATAPETEGSSKTVAIPHKGIARDTDKENLKTLLGYVNARVIPIKKGAICLVCGRYHVTATIVGHLEALKEPRLDGPVKSDAMHKSASRGNPPPRRLVVQSVLNVTASDLYGKLYSPDEFRPVPTE
jgi:hypothetical protein